MTLIGNVKTMTILTRIVRRGFDSRVPLQLYKSTPELARGFLLVNPVAKGPFYPRNNCGISVSSRFHFSTQSNIHSEIKKRESAQKDIEHSKTNKTKNVTKLGLLSQASGPLSKLLIHIKWPLMRNNRPFSFDDLNAFFSWLLMGNVLWIVLGTTTFGLVFMYLVHTYDSAHDTLESYFSRKRDSSAEGISDKSVLGAITSGILSNGLGVKLEFEKGNILPELKDGKLKFLKFKVYSNKRKITNNQEGSQNENSLSFTVNVEEMDITLSFKKWYEGKGLIDELEIYGANGQLFKTYSDQSQYTNENSVDHHPFYGTYCDYVPLDHSIQEHEMGDNEKSEKTSSPWIQSDYVFSAVKVFDSYFEVIDSEESKPLKVSIFNCVLPKLRGNMMLIDFFNADNVTGAVNDSMFTIHKRQAFDSTGEDNKIIRFQVDGINMGTIAKTNSRLKFNWIVNGKAEIVADIRLPYRDLQNGSSALNDYKKFSVMFTKLFDDLVDASNSCEETQQKYKSDDETTLLKGALAAIYDTFANHEESSNIDNAMQLSDYVIVNFKIKFTDLKASLPDHLPMASSLPLPFVSLQNLRSLILFINEHADKSSPIVIKTTAIEKLSALKNIENLSETRICDEIVNSIYEELWKMVKLDEKRIMDEKSSLWSHSVASQLLLLGLGAIV